MSAFIDRYFCITKRGTSLRRELLAGVTNYFTLIYIVLLVPEILTECFPSAAASGGELDNIIYKEYTMQQMLVSISIISFLMTGIASIFAGIITNLPIVQGPSIIIAVFVSNTICTGLGYSYNQALAIVFISGIVFFILSATGAEKRIHQSIPRDLRYAVAAGIGLMITANGLAKAHIISDGSLSFDRTVIIAAAVSAFTIYLLSRGVHAAIFIGKLLCIAIAFCFGLIKSTSINFEMNIIPIPMDFSGLMQSGFLLVIIATICIMDIFETISVFITIHCFTDLTHNEYKSYAGILEADSLTTAIGALMGITNISTYAESSAGITEGGRTGLTSVVSGILFIASIPLTPLVSVIPSVATATTLIAVGIIMSRAVKKINFSNLTLALPAVMTFLIMPLTGSVLAGIGWGMVMYVLINLPNIKRLNYYTVILSVLLAVMLFFLP